MEGLKFLGKPAPEYIGCCGNGEYCNERAGDKDCPCEAKIESLEGAIKEAAELLEKSILEKPIPEFKKWAKTNPAQAINLRNRPGQFVAFLLRKTLGLSPTDNESVVRKTIGERT